MNTAHAHKVAAYLRPRTNSGIGDMLASQIGHLISECADEIDRNKAELTDLRRRLEEATRERDEAVACSDRDQHRLREATKAGTPYWHERDTMNNLVLEVERQRAEIERLKAASPPPPAAGDVGPWTEQWARNIAEHLRRPAEKTA